MNSMTQTRGFSLIEVMVALVIASLLLAGLVTTFTNANTNYGELTKTSRQIENGRYAVSALELDLRHAGFYGEYTGSLATRDPASPPALAAPLPCTDGPAAFLANLVVPVYGYDGAATTPLACIGSNYQPFTDVLVIRRVSTDKETAALAASTVYFQGFLDLPSGGPYLNYGTAAPFDLKYPGGDDVPIRRFMQHIYYISKCSDCSGGGDGIPTLVRLEYTGNATFNLVPLAEGIEDMRIRYGVDNSGLNNGSPAVYMNAGSMALDPDWDSVMAVEVNLLARNNTTTSNHKDEKTYLLGATIVGPFWDEYRRHAFSQVVRVINAASRREE